MAIGELKTRLRAKFSRRHSTASSLSQSSADGEQTPTTPTPTRKTPRSLRSRHSQRPASTFDGATIDEKESPLRGVIEDEAIGPKNEVDERDEATSVKLAETSSDLHLQSASPSTTFANPLEANLDDQKHDSSSATADFPTPNTDIPAVREEDEENEGRAEERNIEINFPAPGTGSDNTSSTQRPSGLSRRQSLLPHQQTRLIKTLLETELPPQSRAANLDYFTANGPSTISPNMVSRKIWVKRPQQSATLVQIHEDDLVDDVRDMILRKYANSLGRNFDAPDVTLRIVPREQRQERTLGPEEPMTRTLDAYYPGGQTVDEALIIDVPLRRTPKPSPQPQRGYYDENRPAEGGSDYFPPMPVPTAPLPQVSNTAPVVNGQANPHHPLLTTHSMSVLTTGHVPALPSPGSNRRHHRDRPRIGRTHTSSPTVIGNSAQAPIVNNGTLPFLRAPRSRTHSSASETSNAPPIAPPLPTPPAPQPSDNLQVQRVATPPPRVSSPRPVARAKKAKKTNAEHPSLPAGMLNGAVPPINVLIVEDNIINLKLLEAFMKRLKVRWQTAMNGREAVTKWRAGGFHLVLMDIQLPIMSGLEATKEIRRLERVNCIGIFGSSASSSAPEVGEEGNGEVEDDDRLPSTAMFKSPVIIVALTASSLQSDRHEALAAGCNDFLTKVRIFPHPLCQNSKKIELTTKQPVNFVWLERKVMEWGCMQALIDFDGWRKWKDFSQSTTNSAHDSEKEGKGKSALEKKKKKNRASLGSANPASSSRASVAGIREEGGAVAA
jgi:osomolarity two-component system, response regulator SSK1